MRKRIRVLVRHKPDREHLLLYFKDPETGRERSKSAGTADAKAAERAAADWERELLGFRGEDGATWAWFRVRFEDEHLVTLSQAAQASYGTALNHFERLVNTRDLAEVGTSELSKFQAALATEGRPNTSIRNYLTHLLSALRWAEGVKLLAHAPRFKLPKVVKSKRKRMRGRPLSETEFRRMMRAAAVVVPWQTNAMRRFLKLLWLSGLRLTEAVRLSWDAPPWQIRLDNQPHPMITIDGEAQKSGADEDLPITPDLAAWLEQTPPERRRGRLVRLVSQHRRQRLTPRQIGRLISAIGKRARVVVSSQGKLIAGKKGAAPRRTQRKYASAHDLRRTFGTRWAAIVHPTTLQKLMRHQDLTTTLRYYVDLKSSNAAAEVWAKSPAP